MYPLLAVVIVSLILQPVSLVADGESQNPNPSDRFWAFIPPSELAPPKVKDEDWPQVPLDYFILGKIEEAGFLPTQRANRRTLVRRAYLDLHGLPPTTGQWQSFLKDDRPAGCPALWGTLGTTLAGCCPLC